jgi:hypothetical protein
VHHLLAFDAEMRAWRGGIAIVGAVLRRGSGAGVMWCGSRAQGRDRLGLDRLLKAAPGVGDLLSTHRRGLWLLRGGICSAVVSVVLRHGSVQVELRALEPFPLPLPLLQKRFL